MVSHRRVHQLIVSVYLVGMLIATVIGFGGAWFRLGNAVPTAMAIDPVDELQQQINDNQKMLDMSVNATKPLESEVVKLSQRLQSAQATIRNLQTEQQKKQDEIKEKEADMADQYAIFTSRIDQQYRQARTFSPIVTLMNTWKASQGQKAWKYTLLLAERDRQVLDDISGNILQLQQDKAAAQDQEKRLASLQVTLNEQKAFFEKEIAGAKAYQAQLETKIAELTTQQQSIIAAKSGSFLTSVGEVPLADDFNASIGYKSKAPSNSFAVFSFGAYTHRNGMSQYGAKARAEEGQSAEEILKAYYPDAKLKKDYDAMDNISVDGHGSMSFEDQYLQGIYEIPSSWDKDALRAQAIAARTYAIRYTDNGSKPICTTERCQVFKNEKKGGAWEEAVNDTKGWVLVDGSGNPVSTQYASTHGGYTNTSGWDTTDKSGDGDWSSRAWDSKAGSPWFYKAWYREGYSSKGNSCGRSHPWISQEEMSDILNAWIVRNDPNGADTGRILPVTIRDCSIGGKTGDPYSMSEMRDFANKSGGAVTNISSVRVSHSSKGQTTQVVFQTNRGEVKLSGAEFKEIFNLRVAGHIRIPQNGFAFFNIEKT